MSMTTQPPPGATVGGYYQLTRSELLAALPGVAGPGRAAQDGSPEWACHAEQAVAIRDLEELAREVGVETEPPK